VLDERVSIGARVLQLVGVAHADQVGGDQAAPALQVRHDVAPQVRRRRVAVEEDDGGPLADIHIGHADAQNLGERAPIARISRNRQRALLGASVRTDVVRLLVEPTEIVARAIPRGRAPGRHCSAP